MNQAVLDILIFAAIAVFLFFKLRNVLGEVDDVDDKGKTSRPKSFNENATKQKNDRLARLNPQQGASEWPTTLPDFKLVAHATAHNSLLQIHAIAPHFDPYHFLQGAKRAFVMIIDAFSKGDKSSLKNLLEADLYESYSDIIDARIEKGETWNSEIVELKNALISTAEIHEDEAKITVDFEAVEKVTARDRDGNFINDEKGEPEKTENRWVFVKNIKDKEPRWRLVETQEKEEI